MSRPLVYRPTLLASSIALLVWIAAVALLLLCLPGCATPIAAIPQDLGQKSDELHDARSGANSGIQINIESLVLNGTPGDLPSLLQKLADTITLTHSAGDVTASASQQGATEQAGTQTGSTGAQEADATGTLEIPLTPGN